MHHSSPVHKRWTIILPSTYSKILIKPSPSQHTAATMVCPSCPEHYHLAPSFPPTRHSSDCVPPFSNSSVPDRPPGSSEFTGEASCKRQHLTEFHRRNVVCMTARITLVSTF